MTLAEILGNLKFPADDLCIVVRRPWSGSADAMLVRPDDRGRLPEYLKDARYEYFLEVSILRDEVLGAWNSQLNVAQRLEVALYYAENDTYPEWFHDVARARTPDT